MDVDFRGDGQNPRGLSYDAPTIRTGEEPPSASGVSQAPLLTVVRHRLVNFRTMSWPLRLFVLLTLAQVVLIGLLTGLHDLPQPTLDALVADDRTLSLPIVAFAVGFISFALAWSALMTGALHGHWIARWLAVAMFGFVVFVIFGDEAIYTIDPVTNQIQAPAGAELLWLPQLALPLVVGIWALVVWLVLRSRARAGKPGRSGALAIVTFIVMFVAILASFALCVAYLGLSNHAEAFPSVLTDELWILSYPLVAALLFAGTDYAEWGEAIAGRLALTRGHPRASWLLALLTAILCIVVLIGVPALILVPGVQLAGNGDAIPRLLLGSFLLDLALIATLAAVIWLGRVRRWPRGRVSFGALLLSTVAVTVAVTFLINGSLISVLLGIAIWPVLGFTLVIRGRWRPGAASAAGLYMIVVGLSVIAFAGAVGAFGQSAAVALSGVQLAAAFFTLVALAWLMVRGRLDAGRASLISRFFMLNGGLLLIGILYIVVTRMGSLSHGYGLIPAVLIVLAFLWDFLTSGEEVTNVEGRAFPRHARVLLYAGYTILVSTIVLFFAPVTPDTIIGQPDLFYVFNADLWPRYGMLLLGVPLLVTNFVLATRTNRERSAMPVTPPAAPPAWPYPQPGYPPQPAYYPPAGAYPPQQPGYPPAGAYPPQQPYYAPQQPYSRDAARGDGH